MPTYEYRCEECDARLEVFAAMSDPPPAACEACGSASLVKVLFPVAVHYKGSGFYSTDYAGKKAPTSGGSDASADTSSSSDSPSSSDSSGSSSGDSTAKPAESKPTPAKSDSGSSSSSSDSK